MRRRSSGWSTSRNRKSIRAPIPITSSLCTSTGRKSRSRSLASTGESDSNPIAAQRSRSNRKNFLTIGLRPRPNFVSEVCNTVSPHVAITSATVRASGSADERASRPGPIRETCNDENRDGFGDGGRGGRDRGAAQGAGYHHEAWRAQQGG